MTQSGDENDPFLPAPGLIPDALHAAFELWIDRVSAQNQQFRQQYDLPGSDQATLVRLVASSEFAAGVLVRQWDWFCTAHGQGAFLSPVTPASLAVIGTAVGDESDESRVRALLRRFRNRFLVHILWRSIREDDQVRDTLAGLSALADALISASIVFASRRMKERFGEARTESGEKSSLVVLAMGKLGGRELNFSSDIDLVFLYTEEGETDGPRTLSAHEYFTRLSRSVVSLLDDVTEDGFVYRVDTRLRPFGDSGPPVVSFNGLENYLVQHGRSWERYAYVKARAISPDARKADIEMLQDSVIVPFVYRRYLDYGVFESLREMKALIAAEVEQRELRDNIKLGPGGIREIEFIVQSMQLVRGGADEKLRRNDLQGALQRIGNSRGLGQPAVAALRSAYYFLRKLENGVQAIRDQQTHDLPVAPDDRARLQIVMGYDSWESLLRDLEDIRQSVAAQFAQVAFRGNSGDSQSEPTSELAALWDSSASIDEWYGILEAHGFDDVADVAAALVRFGELCAPGQVDTTARKRLRRFLCAFLELLKERRNPGPVCERVLRIVTQIVRRSAYVALLNENPAVLERLVALCDQSEYLASEISRFPLLLDELLDPRLYSAEISQESMRADLEYRFSRLEECDSEREIEVLAQYQRATLFRIAVADISGSLPIMKVSDRLTELAEIVLENALRIAWDDLVERHGKPLYQLEAGRRREAGFGVIAYGKLGGMELSYRSDLDLVFLHDSRGTRQETDGPKPLENSMFFSRLVRRLVHFLTAQTSSGALYEVDTRLRPSGRSGLLVVTIDGFEKYQEDNAWTWEHQALLRSRPVAGSAIVAREFERIRADTLRNRVRRERLLDDVLSMRAKMRDQLDKSSGELFDLKQGEGGIGDIEFLVQYLVLKNARSQPALIHYSDNIRQLGTLEAVGCLSSEDVAQLQSAYKTFRLATHHLALDGKPTLVPNDEFILEREFVIAIWEREMSAQGDP